MASRSGKRKWSVTSQRTTFKMCSYCFALMYWGISPLFFKPSMRRQEKKKHLEKAELIQSQGEKTFGHILSSALRNFDLASPDITLLTVGIPVNVSLTAAKNVRKHHALDNCVSPKSLGGPSDKKKLIIILQRMRWVLDGEPLNPEYLDFILIGKTFFLDLFVGTIVGSSTSSLSQGSSSCLGWCLWYHIRPRIWKCYSHIREKFHGRHANIQSQDDTKSACARLSSTSNMCAVPTFHLSLRISRHWGVGISTFSTTDSKWSVRNPPSFEGVHLTLYYIITCVILKSRLTCYTCSSQV